MIVPPPGSKKFYAFFSPSAETIFKYTFIFEARTRSIWKITQNEKFSSSAQCLNSSQFISTERWSHTFLNLKIIFSIQKCDHLTTCLTALFGVRQPLQNKWKKLKRKCTTLIKNYFAWMLASSNDMHLYFWLMASFPLQNTLYLVITVQFQYNRLHHNRNFSH